MKTVYTIYRQVGYEVSFSTKEAAEKYMKHYGGTWAIKKNEENRNSTCDRCGNGIFEYDADLVIVRQGKPVCEGCQCDEDFRPENQAG